eukprot:s2360_g11.t1
MVAITLKPSQIFKAILHWSHAGHATLHFLEDAACPVMTNFDGFWWFLQDVQTNPDGAFPRPVIAFTRSVSIRRRHLRSFAAMEMADANAIFKSLEEVKAMLIGQHGQIGYLAKEVQSLREQILTLEARITPEAMKPTTALDTRGCEEVETEMLEEPAPDAPALEIPVEAKAAVSHVKISMKPSVGTWFRRPVQLRVPIEEPAPDAPALEIPVEAKAAVSHVKFSMKPSVGTWFRRPVQLRVPIEEPAPVFQVPAEAEEPPMMQMAAEEQRTWGNGHWEEQTESPVSEEQTLWRALQPFEIRTYPEYSKEHLTGEILNVKQVVEVTHIVWKYSGSHFLKLANGGYVFTKNRGKKALFVQVGASELREERKAAHRQSEDWRSAEYDWNGQQWRQDGEGAPWGHQRAWPRKDTQNSWPRDGKTSRSWAPQREWQTETKKSWSWNSWGQRWESPGSSSCCSNSKPAFPDPNDPKYRIDFDAQWAAEANFPRPVGQ